MAQQQMVKDERSIGDLFTELATETGTLVRQEMALAQTELTHKATIAGKNIGYLAVGGAVGFTAALSLTTAVILLLSLWMPAWLSALLVGLAVGAAAYFIVTSALTELKKTDPVPRESIESIREDAEWIKNEVT
ncbi:hypothetical protein BH20ACI2_BH20ACI2_18430 [soil metagenome]